MPCIAPPIPNVPSLPEGIGISGSFPTPAFEPKLCCKIVTIPANIIPPLPVSIPITVITALNQYKDAALAYARGIGLDCPRSP